MKPTTLVFLTATLALAIFSACNNSTPAEMRRGVFMNLSTENANIRSLNDAQLTGLIRNYGPNDTVINLYVFENSILALDVVSANGRTHASIPPSVPPADPHAHEHPLKAGDSLKIVYTLNNYSEDPPPPAPIA